MNKHPMEMSDAEFREYCRDKYGECPEPEPKVQRWKEEDELPIETALYAPFRLFHWMITGDKTL